MSRWPPIDLTGKRVHRLTVIGRVDGGTWRCLCDCGKATVYRTNDLKSKKVKSCGCFNDQLCRELGHARRTHGHSMRTPTYTAWSNMLRRCSNKKARDYKNYGGRGVSVCERWKTYANFLADMGDKPSNDLSLDRIDNSGNYEPGNCRWATVATQIRNRRRTRIIECFGQSLTLKEWADRLGISNATLLERLEKWPLERALSEAPRGR